MQKNLEKYKQSRNTIGSGLSFFGVGANIYYQPGAFSDATSPPSPLERAGMNFMVVSVHEIGHTILLEAYGREVSWLHKGTPILSGSYVDATPTAPLVKQGVMAGPESELDIMKYWRELDHVPQYNRFKASTEDVKGFIFKAVRN